MPSHLGQARDIDRALQRHRGRIFGAVAHEPLAHPETVNMSLAVVCGEILRCAFGSAQDDSQASRSGDLRGRLNGTVGATRKP
jgi:hypothetical protein